MVSLKKMTTRVASITAAGLLVAVTLVGNVVLPSVAYAANASTPVTSPTQIAKVSFTFDDGLQSVSTLAQPTLTKYGFTGTSYVTTDCIGMVTVPNSCRADTTKPYMTWDQVKAVAAAGWEIGSHTASHPLLATTDDVDQPAPLTNEQVIAELANSKQAIITNAGITPTAFASPYGDYVPTGNPTVSEIAKLYTSHRGFADTGYNVTPYSGGTLPADNVALNNYLIRTQQIQTTTNGAGENPVNVTVANAMAMVDKAIADKAWLVLTFHEITAGAVAAGDDTYDYSNANLDAIAAYIKSKNVPVVNVSDGINKVPTGTTPVLNEGFEAGLPADWTTDSPTTIKADNAGNGNVTGGATNSVSITSSAATTHLFSPKVTVDPNGLYVIVCYVDIKTAIGEIGFYINEYDATGVEIAQVAGTTGGGYKFSVDAGATNPDVVQVSFTYKPTTTAFMAALQVIAVGNTETAYQAYLDDVKMFSVAGATTVPPVVVPPTAPVGGKGGDANGDNSINALDLSVLLSNWNKAGQVKSQGDMNGDGIVNALDLSTLLANWGK